MYTCRRLHRVELDTYFALRLYALQDSPTAFGTTFADAQSRGPAHYAAACFGDGVDALFGAFTDDGDLVSQLHLFREGGNRRHIAGIGNVFTAPSHRGRGLTSRLINAAIERAREFPEIRRLEISVNAENATALRIYERAGFVAWGREPAALCVDGAEYDEIHLSLRLNPSM